MTERAAQSGFDVDKDPFTLNSSRAFQRQMMTEAGLIPGLVEPSGQKLPPVTDRKEPIVFNMGRTAAQKASEKEQRYLRSAFAFAGALALLVPMIIMVWVSGKVASVVVTTVSICIFSAAIIWQSDLNGKEILGVTSAYAAVLVVFVGASTSPS